MECPWCGSKSYKRVLENIPDIRHRNEGLFNYSMCRECGLIFLEEREGVIKNLKKFYSSPYFRYDPYESRDTRFFRIYYRIIRERFIPITEGKVLDVGCGEGTFLAGLKDKGFDCYGVEMDRKVAEETSMKYGIKVYQGLFEEVEIEDGPFDLITMWWFLEHVTDLKRCMRKAEESLREGGYIIGEVPNFQSLERKVFKRYFYLWDTPRHLYLFTPSSIREILKTSGFREVKIYHRFLDPGFFFESFIEFLEDNLFRRPRVGMRHLKRLIPIGLIPAFVAAITNQGSSIIFVGKKGSGLHS